MASLISYQGKSEQLIQFNFDPTQLDLTQVEPDPNSTGSKLKPIQSSTMEICVARDQFARSGGESITFAANPSHLTQIHHIQPKSITSNPNPSHPTQIHQSVTI